MHPGHAVLGLDQPPCRDGPAGAGRPERPPEPSCHAAALLDLPVRVALAAGGPRACAAACSRDRAAAGPGPKPACRRPQQRCTSPPRTIWGGMQPIDSAGPGVPPARDPAGGGQCPRGLFALSKPKPCHPMDLGADLCCDSAHKTLPRPHRRGLPSYSRKTAPAVHGGSRAKQAMAHVWFHQPLLPHPVPPWTCATGIWRAATGSGCIRLRITYRHSASGFRAWAGTSPRRTLSG